MAPRGLTTGKFVAGAIVATALIAGGFMYWLQVYAFYAPVLPQGRYAITLAPGPDQAADLVLDLTDFQGIDATSSPLRFRACFQVLTPKADVARTAQPYATPEPLLPPGWFDCFEAETIALALQAGTAHAYLGQRDIFPGVDRVVAVFDDGRGFAWHQLNETMKD